MKETLKIPEADIRRLEKKTHHSGITCWFDVSDVADNQKAFYKAVINGKEYTQKSVTVNVLPPLPAGPRPLRFKRIVSWATFGNVYHGTTSSNFMTEAMFPDVYNLLKSIGLNSYLIFNADGEKGWRKYLVDHIVKDGGDIWANIPRGFSKKFTNMHKDGWETNVISGGVKYVEKISGDYYKRIDKLGYVKAIHYDFEPYNAYNKPLWEIEATKKMFAEKYGYKLSSLTKKRLQGELRNKWLDFRTWQIGETLRIWAKYVHSVNPDWEITVSQGDGYPMDKYVNYGAYNDIPNLVHMPQIYLESTMNLSRNIMGLNKTFPNGKFMPVLTAYMVADKDWSAFNSPKTIYSQIISAAMLGCVGVAQWPDIHRGMDMEYMWEISRAMRDISYLEDYVYDGSIFKDVNIEVENIEVDWSENSIGMAYKLDNKILVAFNNMNNKISAKVNVQVEDISGKNWKVVDPVTNKTISSPSGANWSSEELKHCFTFTVPASTLGMLILSHN